MKKCYLISIICITLLSTIQLNIIAQIHCSVEYPPNGKKTSLKSAVLLSPNVGTLKTIRIIVHIPLRDDGTGSFTETTDFYGTVNQYTGYWFAEKFIERSNAWLNSNQEMTQQLSYNPPIPINLINIHYKLAGVIFHRSNTLFNGTSLSTMSGFIETDNDEEAINVFLYHGPGGSGAAWSGSYLCWMDGVKKAYDNFLTYGNWGMDDGIVHGATHEIGHCLQLDHAKRYPGGDCCTNDSVACLDNCNDTPTYSELLNDGYADPCIWNGTGYSNNIMDYSPLIVAWTPCQINIVHSEIENNRQMLYPCGFVTDALNVTSNISITNRTYIAKNISVNNVTVSANKALYISCETFNTNGTFEVKKGAILDITTAPKCN